MHDDSAFLEYVADTLADLPGVEAVALGGSRVYGDPGPETDWDFSVYYRERFDPEDLRAVGWPGEVSEVGAWGGGVFNGGAWMTVDRRRVDVHYRDLDAVDRVQCEVEQGVFQIEPLMFHLAGIPSYILLAELSGGICLRGDLPRPEFPVALRESASRVWRERAEMLFAYAETGHAARGRSLQAIGMAAEASTCAAHAILAAEGRWMTNEKRIFTLAGLNDIDALLRSAQLSGDGVLRLLSAVRERCEKAMAVAGTR